MKYIICLFLCLATAAESSSQELYVFTEPASNMPAGSLTPKISSWLSRNNGKTSQRYSSELMFGFSKKFMLHAGTSFSNMVSGSIRWESVYLYGKYRFLSHDDLHKHFRMALFTDASYSRNPYHHDEISLQGDRSGIQLGLIATQLVNKLAVSGSFSHIQTFDESRKRKDIYSPERIYQAFNYSLSAGLLLLPREYKDFNQLNLNIYTELIGQQTLDRKTHYLDLAPAIQLLFNSNSKLNLGYRFQLSSNQSRNMRRSFLVSFEHTFFNALKKN